MASDAEEILMYGTQCHSCQKESGEPMPEDWALSVADDEYVVAVCPDCKDEEDK